MTFGNFTGTGWSWDDFVAEVFAPEHEIIFTYNIPDIIGISVPDDEVVIDVDNQLCILVPDKEATFNIENEIIIYLR